MAAIAAVWFAGDGAALPVYVLYTSDSPGMGPKSLSAIEVSFASRSSAGYAIVLVAVNEDMIMALHNMARCRETCIPDVYLRV